MMEIRPRTTFVCRCCERECKNDTYAIDPQGAKICDYCVLILDLATVENDKKIFAYLSKATDTKHIVVSNWIGNVLAKVIAYYKKPAGHCGEQTYILAITKNGRLLSGRGPGVGMYCRLRPIKHWPNDIYGQWEAKQMHERYQLEKKG